MLHPARAEKLRKYIPQKKNVSSRDVVVKILNFDIVVCKFELQSDYYLHFQTKV